MTSLLDYHEKSLVEIPDVKQPNHFGCILPHQNLQGNIIGASKAWYSGEAIKIYTSGGTVLSVTPNHPILTMKGFLAAGNLTKGEDLLHYVGENKSVGRRSSNNKQYAPTFVEDVFSSFLDISRSILSFDEIHCSPLDFHGDAAGFDGNIHIVGSYRKLRSFDFGSSLRHRSGVHPEFHSFGAGSHLNVFLNKDRRNDLRADLVLAGQLLDGTSGQVFLDKIINIERFHYNGPIYDFESIPGYIIIENIFVSNCGAAASMSVARYFGVGPKTEKEWENVLGTSVEKSTSPKAIIEYLQSLGLQVEARSGMDLNDLKEYHQRGWPVIVCVQDYGKPTSSKASYNYGHYLSVIGIDHGYVFCQDSSEDNVLKGTDSIAAPGKIMIEEQTFLDNWHDKDEDGNRYIRFGIAVGPPLKSIPKSIEGYETKDLKTSHKYGCLLSVLPDPIRKQLSDWTLENILECHVGTGGIENLQHVTLKYGFKDDSNFTVKALEQLLSRQDPIEIKLTRISTFPAGDDGIPFKIDIESPQLHKLNAEITASFDTHNKFPEYHPHITLCYLDPACLTDYTKIPAPFIGSTVVLNSVRFVTKDKQATEIPFNNLFGIGIKSSNVFGMEQTAIQSRPPQQAAKPGHDFLPDYFKSCPKCGSEKVARGTDGGWSCKNPPCDWYSLRAGGKNVPKVRPSLFFVKALQKPVNFTGEIKDKRGYRRCYNNGKPVVCPKKEVKTSDNKRKQKPKLEDVLSSLKLTTENGWSDKAVESMTGLLNQMTVKDLQQVRKQLGTKTAGKKADLVAKMKEKLQGYLKNTTPAAVEKPTKTSETKQTDEIDLMQKDPNNPIAKAIREDKASGEILKKMLEAFKFADRDTLRNNYDKSVKEMQKIGAEYNSDDPKWKQTYQQVNDTTEKLNDFIRTEDIIKVKARDEFVKLMKPKNPAKIKIAYAGDGSEIKFNPTDVQKKSIENGVNFIQSITEGTGFENTIKFSEADQKNGGRAYFKRSSSNPRIAVGKSRGEESDSGTMAHELGHYIDEMKPGVKKKVLDFLAYRIENEPSVDLGTVPGGARMKGEKGRKDNFDRFFQGVQAYYVGKDYSWGATEIISMGVEALYKDPAGFMKKDPEYAQFIIGILRS